MSAATRLGLDRRAARACWSAPHLARARRRQARPQGESARRRDQRASRDAWHPVLPERAGGRAVLAPGARRRARSRRAAVDAARVPRRAPPPTPAAKASTSSRCRARASSRSCSSPRAAICARRRSTHGPSAARTAARPTTAPSSPRSGAAGRAGAAARLRQLRRLQPRRHDGEDARRSARPADRGVGAGARAAPRRSAKPCRSCARAEGGNFAHRAVGLALLRREGAQGALRLRRGGDASPIFSSKR